MKTKNAGYIKVNEVFFCWEFSKDDCPHVCLFNKTEKGIVLQKYSYDNSGYFHIGCRKTSEVIDEFVERLKAKESPKLLAWEYGEGYLDCIKTAEKLADEMRKEVEK